MNEKLHPSCKILLLLSGGMDSSLCLHLYGAELAIGFDYGQDHLIELEYAQRIADHYKVPFEKRTIPQMPRVNPLVFAGRNAVLLSMGAAIAQSRGLNTVVIGSNFSDAQDFPDCRPVFITEMSRAFREAYGVTLAAPLLRQTKAQIKNKAKLVGLPETWTCYFPKDGKPCGECYSCKGLQ